jgi:PAS domain S-box-containing protein
MSTPDELARPGNGANVADALFRLIGRHSSQVVSVRSFNGEIRFISENCRRALGYRPDELLGRGYLRFVHPDDKPTVDRFFEELRLTGYATVEFRYYRTDGSTGWLETSGAAFGSGDCALSDQAVVLTCDVTERVAALDKLDRSRRQLRQSEERYRRLVESIEDYAIFMLDANGCIASWTSGAEKITGYSSDEITGRHFSCFYTAEDVACDHAAEALSVAKLHGRFHEEGARLRKDGSRFWASVSITAVRDERGALLGYSNILRDITARIESENKVRRDEQMFRALLQQAEQANRAKGDFLAAVSHEIRTPMNSILGMSELLSETGLSEEQRRYVDIFRQAGANLLTLINDILDFSKIEAGRMELERAEFHIRALIGEVVDLVSLKARSKALDVRADVSPLVPDFLAGDAARLRQILINLLGNAVKFTDAGAAVLSVQPTEQGVEFTVADTGIGIPEDQLRSIFDDFKQGDASITRRYGGTGLGLGISRRLVEMMGGELTVASVVGAGSVFRFVIPLEAVTVAREPQIQVRDFEGRRAAVVDSDATNRLIMRETLASWGFDVAEFAAAKDAVRAIREAAGGRAFCIATIERKMKGADGFAILAEVRAVAPSMPVIMLASEDIPGDDALRRANVHTAYAIRPVTRAALLLLVSKALHRADAASGPACEPAAVARFEPQRPLDILVAEDSADNRLLVQLYMQNSPHRLTFAGDGEEALEALRAKRFDLVLMDMQMPVMDGLTATRKIRLREQLESLPAIPILALSANARPEDIRASLAAGCNAHLSKPISKRRLLEAVEQHASVVADDCEELADELASLIPGYLEGRRADASRLRELLAEADFSAIRRIAHNIKGTGGSYGFRELTRFGESLQSAADAADRDSAEREIAWLEGFLATTA